MYIVNNITANSKQAQNVLLPDGTSITVRFEYKPLQSGWFFTEITYGNFTLHGLRMCTAPNILRQFRNMIPFGIMVATQNNAEPTQQMDFFSGFAQMYVLTKDEIAQMETFLTNG